MLMMLVQQLEDGDAAAEPMMPTIMEVESTVTSNNIFQFLICINPQALKLIYLHLHTCMCKLMTITLINTCIYAAMLS